MAKVTEVKLGTLNKNLGTFKCESYNLFEEEDRQEYAELRTLANDASSGIKIEHIREYSRKTVVREEGGEGAGVVTTTEDIILVVSYWDKQINRTKGDTDEEVDTARRTWGRERAAGGG